MDEYAPSVNPESAVSLRVIVRVTILPALAGLLLLVRVMTRLRGETAAVVRNVVVVVLVVVTVLDVVCAIVVVADVPYRCQQQQQQPSGPRS